MIEISCSTDDLASTPSNRSEYFSVNSSLNILDSAEDVYHSFDEEIEPQITCDSIRFYNRRIQHVKIIKQHHLEIEVEENVCLLSTSVDTIPETDTCRNSAECDRWDKCSPPLRMVKSEESINTFEEEIINSSVYSNSQIKDSSITDDNINHSISENEESASTNLLNTSHIEGELSDINDIIYDSSVSPVNAMNPVISAENDSSQLETSNTTDEVPECHDTKILSETLESETELQIYELVKKLESNHQLEYEPIVISLANDEEEAEAEEVICPKVNRDDEKTSPVKSHISINEEPPNQIMSTTEIGSPKKERIGSIEDSPVKKSFLCCAIRKKKKRSDSPKSKLKQKSKAKQFFLSLFKKPTTTSTTMTTTIDKKTATDKDVIIEQNNFKCHNATFVNSIDYDGIPFIDADATIDSEEFISLAKQEIFSE